jgi:hypothetical protein
MVVELDGIVKLVCAEAKAEDWLRSCTAVECGCGAGERSDERI